MMGDIAMSIERFVDSKINNSVITTSNIVYNGDPTYSALSMNSDINLSNGMALNTQLELLTKLVNNLNLKTSLIDYELKGQITNKQRATITSLIDSGDLDSQKIASNILIRLSEGINYIEEDFIK